MPLRPAAVIASNRSEGPWIGVSSPLRRRRRARKGFLQRGGVLVEPAGVGGGEQAGVEIAACLTPRTSRVST